MMRDAVLELMLQINGQEVEISKSKCSQPRVVRLADEEFKRCDKMRSSQSIEQRLNSIQLEPLAEDSKFVLTSSIQLLLSSAPKLTIITEDTTGLWFTSHLLVQYDLHTTLIPLNCKKVR